MRIEYEPIGIIHSPYTDLKGMPIQPAGAKDVRGSLEIFEDYREGLQDIEGFSHIILVYHFHRSQGYSLRVTPFLDETERGLFATRAPKRPNPIGLSIVRLDGVSGGTLNLRNVDILDGTPLLDLKPYVPAFDAQDDVRTGWLETSGRSVVYRHADDRFA